MQPALEVRRIRVFDPETKREYASGCRVSREDYRSPEFAVKVPLNVTYAADVYTTDVWTSAPRDTRSAASICGEQHEPVILKYRDVPSCLRTYTSTILAVYPIDENGVEVDFATTSTQLGVRYVMTPIAFAGWVAAALSISPPAVAQQAADTDSSANSTRWAGLVLGGGALQANNVGPSLLAGWVFEHRFGSLLYLRGGPALSFTTSAETSTNQFGWGTIEVSNTDEQRILGLSLDPVIGLELFGPVAIELGGNLGMASNAAVLRCLPEGPLAVVRAQPPPQLIPVAVSVQGITPPHNLPKQEQLLIAMQS